MWKIHLHILINMIIIKQKLHFKNNMVKMEFSYLRKLI